MKDLIKTIWNILKQTNRIFTFFRNAVLNFLFLCFLLILVVAFMANNPKKSATLRPSTAENSILQVKIEGAIVEQKPFTDSIQKLLDDIGDTPQNTTYLQDILDAINHAKDDPKIKAILVNSSKMTDADLNQLHSIGNALLRFRKSGKKVIAAADSYRQSDYYLASFADKILLNPMGQVDIHGMSRNSLYFKDALDKLKVNYNIFKVGTYKSAVEPLTRNSMSDADRQQSSVWLNGLWEDYRHQVTTNRHLQPGTLQSFTENVDKKLKAANGNPAIMAQSEGFVDMLATRLEMSHFLHTTVNLPDRKKIPFISINDYIERTGLTPSYSKKSGNIGIVIAEGIIMDGKQGYGRIGGDSLANLIESARLDKNIKALVLRVNSGGGSAFASEIIRQELLAFKKSGKKLVVSMGSMAASGGYWISVAADKIIATPSTLTGSIGVFGVIPTFNRSLNAIGVHSDGVGTTPIADGINLSQPLNPIMGNLIQQYIEQTYDAFLSVVSRGRHIPKEKVAEIAQGHVYDGLTAQRLGLVDKMGDLSDAIATAAELAKLQHPAARYIQPERSVQEQLMDLLGSVRIKATAFLTGGKITEAFSSLQNNLFNDILINFNDPNHVYSYTPPLQSSILQ